MTRHLTFRQIVIAALLVIAAAVTVAVVHPREQQPPNPNVTFVRVNPPRWHTTVTVTPTPRPTHGCTTTTFDSYRTGTTAKGKATSGHVHSIRRTCH